MSVSPDRSSPLSDPVRHLDQIYYTHCLPQDDYLNSDGGFSIRAASLRDLELFRFVRDNCSYKLPIDLRGQTPQPEQTPRRLARLKTPHGQTALVHTTYARSSSDDRPNSFFTHVLLSRYISPLDALRSWAAPSWATDYPTGASKHLPSLKSLPVGNQLSDALITAFLAPKFPILENQLATLLIPPRLANEAPRRRELLCQLLCGCLRVMRSQPGESRQRLFLLAEPGLMVLLLFATLRLLRDSCLSDLTFTTYEYHGGHDLKQYRLARVIGTYTNLSGHPPLPDECFQELGYAIDSFHHRCSIELQTDIPQEVNHLIDFAASGEWNKIDTCYAQSRSENPTLTQFRTGLELLEARHRLLQGKGTDADLVVLKQHESGRELLTQQESLVWEIVRRSIAGSSAFLESNRELLRKHLQELLADLSEQAIQPDLLSQWKAHWNRLTKILSRDELKQVFRETIAAQSLVHISQLRLPLLKTWHELNRLGEELLSGLEPLLSVRTAEDLTQIVQSQVPISWRVLAIYKAIKKGPPLISSAVELLQSADEQLLSTFWHNHFINKSPDLQSEALSLLLSQQNFEKKEQMLQRILNASWKISPAVLHQALNKFGAYKSSWLEFWLKHENLSRWLTKVSQLSKEKIDAWQSFTSQLNEYLIVKRDGQQKQLLTKLTESIHYLADLVPDDAKEAVLDWDYLEQFFSRPHEMDQEQLKLLLEVCKRRGLRLDSILQQRFQNIVIPARMEEATLEAFVTSFEYCQESGEEWKAIARRFETWLELLKVCTDARQVAAYQKFYLMHHVIKKFRLPLIQRYQSQLEPGVAEAIQNELAQQHVANTPITVPQAIRLPEDFAPSCVGPQAIPLHQASPVQSSTPVDFQELLDQPSGTIRSSNWILVVVLGAFLLLFAGGWGLIQRLRNTPPVPQASQPAPIARTGFTGATSTIWDKNNLQSLLSLSALVQQLHQEMSSVNGIADLPRTKHQERLQAIEDQLQAFADSTEKLNAKSLGEKLSIQQKEAFKLLRAIKEDELRSTLSSAQESLLALERIESADILEEVRKKVIVERNRQLDQATLTWTHDASNWSGYLRELNDTITSIQILRSNLTQIKQIHDEMTLALEHTNLVHRVLAIDHLIDSKQLEDNRKRLDSIKQALQTKSLAKWMPGTIEGFLKPTSLIPIRTALAEQIENLQELSRTVSNVLQQSPQAAPLAVRRQFAELILKLRNPSANQFTNTLGRELDQLCGRKVQEKIKDPLYLMLAATENLLTSTTPQSTNQEAVHEFLLVLLEFISQHKANRTGKESAEEIAAQTAQARQNLAKLLQSKQNSLPSFRDKDRVFQELLKSLNGKF